MTVQSFDPTTGAVQVVYFNDKQVVQYATFNSALLTPAPEIVSETLD